MGLKCKCGYENYEIWHYKHNHSHFEYPKGGEHYSEYSTIHCKKCNAVWRTKAKYVEHLTHRK